MHGHPRTRLCACAGCCLPVPAAPAGAAAEACHASIDLPPPPPLARDCLQLPLACLHPTHHTHTHTPHDVLWPACCVCPPKPVCPLAVPLLQAGVSAEEHLLNATRAWNVAVRERPHDETLWLEFAAFQHSAAALAAQQPRGRCGHACAVRGQRHQAREGSCAGWCNTVPRRQRD